MRVAFLLQDTGAMYGAERATLDLAAGLNGTDDIDVSLALIRETRLGSGGDAVRDAFESSGIEATLLLVDRPFSWKLVKDIRGHVLARRIDCLHVVGYKAAVHGGLAARFGRLCPCVNTVHGWLERPDVKERFYGWIDLQMLKRSQRVVVLSSFYREKLAQRGVPRERIEWIPSGLNLDGLSVDLDAGPLAASGGKSVIGILGRLSWEKNHAMFLRVARRLLDCGAKTRFLIAGDGPERACIEETVRELGLDSVVEVAGRMDRDEFFRRIDLLAVCSRIENLPCVILEAMAWSRPVVATNVGGVPDLIESDVNGVLVDDEDVDGMAEAIRRLLSDAARTRAMGGKGRQTVLERFTLEQSVAAHIELYRNVAAGRCIAC